MHIELDSPVLSATLLFISSVAVFVSFAFMVQSIMSDDRAWAVVSGVIFIVLLAWWIIQVMVMI